MGRWYPFIRYAEGYPLTETRELVERLEGRTTEVTEDAEGDSVQSALPRISVFKEGRIMATLTVEVTVEQLLETIKHLPEGEQAELFDSLEDYFLGKHIEATEGGILLSREETRHCLAQTDWR